MSSSPSIDPLSTPTDAIQRILYLAPKVHVYAIPPLSSNKGHQASTWTSSPGREIFTARLRVIETSAPTPPSTKAPISSSSSSSPPLSVSILLEDPSTGELFAGAPYNALSVVEAAVDSSRFFAVRVQGDDGRKAVLGIGFEERSEALDFNIALQAARKVLGLDASSQPGTPIGVNPATGGKGGGIRGKGRTGDGEGSGIESGLGAKKKDWTLKEGETLHLSIGGGKSGVRREMGGVSEGVGMGKGIEPPSGGGQLSATGLGFGLLPPPPSAKEIREERRRSREVDAAGAKKKLEELGFDDGEFGEFQ